MRKHGRLQKKNKTKVSYLALLFLLGGTITKDVSAQEIGNDSLQEFEERELILKDGELIPNPWKGAVEISDEELLCKTEDGGLKALKPGEVDIIVRYHITIEEYDKNDKVGLEEDTDFVDKKYDNAEEKKEENSGEHQSPNHAEASSVNDNKEDMDNKEDSVNKGEEPEMIKEVPVLQTEKGKPKISYDRNYENAVLTEDFTPRLSLENPQDVTVISCSVNGREADYQINDGEMIIPKDALERGKNRIIITVKDQQGDLTVMEPWEFFIGDGPQMDKEDEKNKDGETEAGEKKTSGGEEKGISLGMFLVLMGSSLVYYEKNRYGKKFESEE